MKLLTNDQIETIKKPNRRGRKKTPLTEVYEAAYEKTDTAFKTLKQIAELLPYIKKSPIKSKYNDFTIELFDAKNFEPILSAMFPLGEEEGAPLDDKTYFEESKINVQTAIFASRILKFSGDYLLQAFPQQEYPNLHNRINELVNDLNGMTESFNRNQELQRQLDKYKQHVNYFEPVDIEQLDRIFKIECLSCRSYGSGKTELDAVSEIKHLSKCEADKKFEDTSKIWHKWYRIIPPKQLLITWKERKLLDKLSKIN